MTASVYSAVHIPHSLNDKIALSKLLGDLLGCGEFDDIRICSDRQLTIKRDGELHRFGREITHSEVELLVNKIGSGEGVCSDVLRGNQKDGNLRLTYKEQPRPLRFRYNMVAQQNNGRPGVRITLRHVKTLIPTIDFTGISQELFESLMPKQGLVLVVGETGSGKTTTIASVLGHAIRTNYVSGYMDTYEHPVEYYLEDLMHEVIKKEGHCSIEVSHHEVEVDLPSFNEGVRNALRSNPDIILVGELRDRESMAACINLALSGHLVFATLHAASSIETISRIASAFDESSRDSIRMDLSQAIRAILVQKFAKGIAGNRILLREQLLIDRKMRRSLRRAEPAEIMQIFQQNLDVQGTSMEASAVSAYENHLIDKRELERVLA